MSTHVHRVRHIDAVHLRNLTPFPARDSLTNALAHGPATVASAPVDDIELTISRRRQRKTSEGTLRSLDSFEDRPRLGARTASGVPAVPQLHTVAPTDSSQRALEKVIASRLLETFVTFSAPHSRFQRPQQPIQSPTLASASAAVSSSPPASGRRGTSISSLASVPRSPSIKSAKSAQTQTQTQTALKSPRRTAFPMSPPPTPRNSIIIPSSSRHPGPITDAEPFFKSAIYRPSTNPQFDVAADPQASGLSAVSESQVVIAVWGRTPSEAESSTFHRRSRTLTSLKGKERENQAASEWRLLFSYDLDLNQLQPLPAELASNPSKLPSNTLLLHLSPPDAVYWLPPAPSPSRPVSPEEAGSDGELDISTVRGKRHRRRSTPSRHDVPEPPPTPKARTTSTVNALHKLVHLQATLTDTQQSLDKIVANCNALLVSDTTQPAKREVSEREERLRLLREQRDMVQAKAREKQAAIEARRAALAERRATLQAGHAILDEEDAFFISTSDQISDLESSRAELVVSIDSRRADLLHLLSSIFPITPVSAPHLLFAIVGMPMPVPSSAEETGPPLTLPPSVVEELAEMDPDLTVDVSEDGVAAALGYVAQLLMLMSRYLGKRLVYPVTCVGSRSLIRDGISDISGPRMFPLYTRGVDERRFLYAVYLLNKNIELLMMDRNLQATDYNQTLPNLMNLLLTLTRPELEQPHSTKNRRPSSPHLSVKDLHGNSARTPVPGAKPGDPSTAAGTIGELPGDATPTAAAPPRRSMFNFTPLAEMLRSRYPTVAKNTPAPPHPAMSPPPMSPPTDVIIEGEEGTSEPPALQEEPAVDVATVPLDEPTVEVVKDDAVDAADAPKPDDQPAEAHKGPAPALPPVSVPKPSRMAGMLRFMGVGSAASTPREEKAPPVLPTEPAAVAVNGSASPAVT